MREKTSIFLSKATFHSFSMPEPGPEQMKNPVKTFAFPIYYVKICSSWQRLGVSACAQFEILLSKLGPLVKVKLI